MNISFKQYVEEFNHTHRFSKEFLDKIFDYAEKIYSGDIVMGNYPPATTVAHVITYITNRLTPPLYINIPLLEFMSYDHTQISYSLNYDRLISFIIHPCAANDQVFIDRDIINTRLSPTQTDMLASIVFELLINNNDSVVEDMCEQLLQTDIGKQCIINIYNMIETHCVNPSEEDEMEMLQVLYPYAQKALAVGGITADDIKDLFDI